MCHHINLRTTGSHRNPWLNTPSPGCCVAWSSHHKDTSLWHWKWTEAKTTKKPADVISRWTAGSFSLLSPKPLEITFDCSFGTEFNTLRNVPGSLEVLIHPRGGRTEALGSGTWRVSPFWGLQRNWKPEDGLKVSELSWRMSLCPWSVKFEYKDESHLQAFSGLS